MKALKQFVTTLTAGLLIVLAVGAATVAAPAQPPSELTDEQRKILVLVHHASRITGYPIPEAPLSIYEVPPAVMAALACRGRLPCPVLGLYQDQNVIFIRDDLTPAARDHIRFHEIVHWLQHHSGKFNLGRCTDTVEREIEAYRAQNRYIAEVQGGFRFFAVPPMSCPPTEAKH